MHRAGNGCQKGLGRTVSANHLDRVADLGVGFNELAYDLRWAASRGRESANGVKYMQNESLGLAEFGSNRFMLNQEPAREFELSRLMTPH